MTLSTRLRFSLPQPDIKAIVAAVAFACIIVLTPWETISRSGFRDIENYLTRISEIRRFTLEYFDFGESLLALASSEYLWSWLIWTLSQMGVSPSNFLLLVSTFSASVSCYYLARRLNPLLAIILLTNPISIDLYYSQVRSAFAFSLVLIALELRERHRGFSPVSISLIAVSPFFHTAMPIILLIALMSEMVAKARLKPESLKIILLFGASLVFSLLLSGLGAATIGQVGDNRLAQAVSTKSLSYLLFWICLSILLSTSRSDGPVSSWQRYFPIAVILVSVVGELRGLPIFRFVALSLPIIFSELRNLNLNGKRILIFVLPAYYALLFSYWSA